MTDKTNPPERQPADKTNPHAELVKQLEAWSEDQAVSGLGDYEKGLLCGVEDRDLQRDGYGAMRYGYDRALERVAEYIDPLIAALSRQPEGQPAGEPVDGGKQ